MLLIFYTNVAKFSRELRQSFYREMYGKMKTFIVAFLTKLFLSNVISKFFYLAAFTGNA